MSTNSERVFEVFPKREQLMSVKRNVPCTVEGCCKRFGHEGMLKMHLVKAHGLIVTESDKRLFNRWSKSNDVSYTFFCPEKECKYSNEKRTKHFSSFHLLKQHFLKIHAEKKHFCKKCKKGFSESRFLRHHEDQCGNLYTCETCPVFYTTREALLTHCKRQKHIYPDKYRLRDREKEEKQKSKKGSKTTDVSKVNQLPVVPVVLLTVIKQDPVSSLPVIRPKPSILVAATGNGNGQIIESGTSRTQTGSLSSNRQEVMIQTDIYGVSSLSFSGTNQSTLSFNNGKQGLVQVGGHQTSDLNSGNVLSKVNMETANNNLFTSPSSPKGKAKAVKRRSSNSRPGSPRRKRLRTTTGIQTSVSLTQRKRSRVVSVSGTQTTGDLILRKAMAEADIPIEKKTVGSQVTPQKPNRSTNKTTVGTDMFIGKANVGTDMLISKTNVGTDMFIGKANVGTDMLISKTNVGTDMFIGKANVGTDMLISKTNVGTDMLISKTNVGTDMFIGKANVGTDMLISKTNVGTDMLISKTNVGTDMFIDKANVGTDMFIDKTNVGTDSISYQSSVGTDMSFGVQSQAMSSQLCGPSKPLLIDSFSQVSGFSKPTLVDSFSQVQQRNIIAETLDNMSESQTMTDLPESISTQTFHSYLGNMHDRGSTTGHGVPSHQDPASYNTRSHGGVSKGKNSENDIVALTETPKKGSVVQIYNDKLEKSLTIHVPISNSPNSKQKPPDINHRETYNTHVNLNRSMTTEQLANTNKSVPMQTNATNAHIDALSDTEGSTMDTEVQAMSAQEFEQLLQTSGLLIKVIDPNDNWTSSTTGEGLSSSEDRNDFIDLDTIDMNTQTVTDFDLFDDIGAIDMNTQTTGGEVDFLDLVMNNMQTQTINEDDLTSLGLSTTGSNPMELYPGVHSLGVGTSDFPMISKATSPRIGSDHGDDYSLPLAYEAATHSLGVGTSDFHFDSSMLSDLVNVGYNEQGGYLGTESRTGLQVIGGFNEKQAVQTETQTTGSGTEYQLVQTETQTTGSDIGYQLVQSETQTTGSETEYQLVQTETQTTGSDTGYQLVQTETQTTGSDTGYQLVQTETQTTGNETEYQLVQTETQTTGSDTGYQLVQTETQTTGNETEYQLVQTETQTTGSETEYQLVQTETQTTGNVAGDGLVQTEMQTQVDSNDIHFEVTNMQTQTTFEDICDWLM